MKITLCMIARDEEAHLARCLESVRGVVDEVVLVDTGSTDRTVEIARGFGADVHALAWPDDFAAARNASLERASGDWVLVLDADEELSPEAAERVRPLVAGGTADGYQLVQRSFLPEGELCRYRDLRITRLFRRRPEHRYEQPIHEQVQPSILRAGGTVARTGLVILHHGYAQATVQGGGDRARRNLALLERAAVEAPGDAYLAYQLGITYKALGEPERANAELRRALALEPGGLGEEIDADLHMRLAQLELGADRYASAIEQAGRCLRRDAGNVVALYVLGIAHLYLGQARRAQPFLERVRSTPHVDASTAAQLDALLAHCRAAP